MFQLDANLQYTGQRERIEDPKDRLNIDIDFVMTLEGSGIIRTERSPFGRVEKPFGAVASFVLSKVRADDYI